MKWVGGISFQNRPPSLVVPISRWSLWLSPFCLPLNDSFVLPFHVMHLVLEQTGKIWIQNGHQPAESDQKLFRNSGGQGWLLGAYNPLSSHLLVVVIGCHPLHASCFHSVSDSVLDFEYCFLDIHWLGSFVSCLWFLLLLGRVVEPFLLFPSQLGASSLPPSWSLGSFGRLALGLHFAVTAFVALKALLHLLLLLLL